MTLPKPCYITSGPHLSGYRVTLGYTTLAEMQDAHSFLATTPAEAGAVGTSAASALNPPDPKATEVVVPREPTPAMCVAGGIAMCDARETAETSVDEAAACYAAMISTAEQGRA